MAVFAATDISTPQFCDTLLMDGVKVEKWLEKFFRLLAAAKRGEGESKVTHRLKAIDEFLA